MKINLSLYLFLIMEMLVEATEKNRELNLNFLQDDYQLKFERLELVRYNKQLFKDFSVVTFKYNRTTAAVNATFTVKYDVGRDIEAIVQAYKFMSNEYRSFPIHFAANAYKALDANVAGTRGFFNCGNYTGFPFIKFLQNDYQLKFERIELVRYNKDFLKEIYGSRSLKGVRLTVPRAVRAGHSVTLGCDYDLEDAPLYSVKWYRGTDEFYRYVPKEEPPTRVFPQAGLHVDVSVSNARKVTLLSVGRPLSGVFQCEVSADAPLFHTEIRASPMTVVVVPDGAPVVSVDRGGLERGGPLLADCTAPPASPAPNLTWYVNDQRVPGSTSTSVKVDEDLLETATSRLELTGVGGSWGTIRLRCEATVFRLYKANSLELEVRPDSPTPQPASVLLMGPSLNGKPYLLSSRPFLYTSVSLVLLRWRCQTAS